MDVTNDYKKDDENYSNKENCRESFNTTVCDWQSEKKENGRKFFDDGTMTYFWRAHTLTTVFLLVCFLLYEAVLSPAEEDVVDNTKRGFVAMVSAFILLGVTVTPDGPFKRPHPALWRFTFTCSIVYELIFIFALYQSANGARKLLKHIDPKLGEPLEEKDYGGNCLIYDPGMPNNPYHNVWDKMDLFVPLHFFGWWMKTLLLRDWWLCWVISVMFEVLEYTLEHQLPNFSECWWDHWIMDALVCNGLGIYCGLLTLNFFTMKVYHWRGLWNIPSYRGKLQRVIGQFGPYVWVSYEWKPLSSLGRWFSTLAVIATFLLAELNTFYLKFVLWIPPGHWVNLFRLLFVISWGAVALREAFQYLDDPDYVKLGRQSVLVLSIILTEFLLIIKFGWETVTVPFPRKIIYLWLGIFCLLLLWTIWNFVIHPHTIKLDPEDEEKRRSHWQQVKDMETNISSYPCNTSAGVSRNNSKEDELNSAALNTFEITDNNASNSCSTAFSPAKNKPHTDFVSECKCSVNSNNTVFDSGRLSNRTGRANSTVKSNTDNLERLKGKLYVPDSYSKEKAEKYE